MSQIEDASTISLRVPVTGEASPPAETPATRTPTPTETNPPKKSQKKTILISAIAAIILAGVALALHTLIFNKFTVTAIAERYYYDDFIAADITTNCDNAIWTSGDYDFFQGKDPGQIPIVAGKNTIKITCDGNEKTFETEISMEDALLTTELAISPDLMDYDGDGLPNKYEKDNGLATYTSDTDNDGLEDNVELAMNLDPKSKDDANTEREWKIFANYDEKTKVELTAKGKGNIANTFIDTVDTNPFGDSEFIASEIVKVSTTSDQKPSELKLSFSGKYDDAHAVYQLNPATNGLKELTSNDIALSNNGITLAAATPTGKTVSADSYDAYYFVGKMSERPSGGAIHQIGIVLDNSGSMYSCEYMRKVLKDPKLNCSTNINNDLDFKRIDLMNSLIDQLSAITTTTSQFDTSNMRYSVSAFTQDYCALQDWSQSAESAKSAIASVKTNCQNFNGTRVQDSVKKMANSISAKQWGSKYVIVLTDGKESCGGLFSWCPSLSSSELKKYKENGIRIITICLGVCDTEMLQNIASETDGKYLLASDAAGLSELKNLIIGNIKQSSITENIGGNDTPDLLVADSGFRAAVDGLRFPNYVTKEQPNGTCFGISRLTRDIYIGALQSNYKAKDWPAVTITETNKDRLTKGKVYNNTSVNKIYKWLATLEEKLPEDYRVTIDGSSMINPSYRQSIIDAGFKPLISETTSGQRESAGYLDTKTAEVADEYRDDFQLLLLGNIAHRIEDKTGAAYNDIIDTLLSIKLENYWEATVDAMDIQAAIAKLASGTPVLFNMQTYGIGHSVLGEAIYMDTSEETYYVKIYDNNYPGEDRVGKFTRHVYDVGEEGPHSAYSFRYDGGGGTTYTHVMLL